jgi:hypothetical protein
MHSVALLRLAATGLAVALVQAVAAPQAPGGVTPEWDVRSNMAAMAQDLRKLEPLLKQVSPAEWVAKGAPEVYVRQLQSAQAGLQGLIAAATKLATQPERLAPAIDAYFQMERMELLLASLGEGIRKYQDSEMADTLARSYAENTVHRDRLRQHIRDIADTREQEFQVANQEAQRCREMMLRQTPSARQPATGRKNP